MKSRFNYLGLLSLLAGIGFIGFINRENSHVFSFFAFLAYVSYFRVKPDELFQQRVLQSASLAFILTAISMISFFIGYIVSDDINFFINGFWISFTLMIISFPLVFLYFEIRDGAQNK